MTSTDTIVARPAGMGSQITYHVELDLHGVATLATPVRKLEFEKLAYGTEKQMIDVLNRL